MLDRQPRATRREPEEARNAQRQWAKRSARVSRKVHRIRGWAALSVHRQRSALKGSPSAPAATPIDAAASA
jgi:hypothetical protein